MKPLVHEELLSLKYVFRAKILFKREITLYSIILNATWIICESLHLIAMYAVAFVYSKVCILNLFDIFIVCTNRQTFKYCIWSHNIST